MKYSKGLFRTAVVLLLVICMFFVGCDNTANDTTETVETIDMFSNSMQKCDPAEDDVFNVLLLGNSGLYYIIEELYGLAEAAGIKMRVCNMYVGSSTLQQHWNWLHTGEAKYQYRVVDETGFHQTLEANFAYGIKQQNWDAIGICEGAMQDQRKGPAERIVSARDEYLTGLLGYFRKEFPMTKLFWQQSSAYQIGYNKSFMITSFADQQTDCMVYRDIAKLVSERYNIGWVPRGDAAQIARANPVIGDVLTARLGVNGNLGDMYHDGDIGGGQYLTASVWFEILTGRSCIGNTYRPDYELSEEKIAALQQAAHEAVAKMND